MLRILADKALKLRNRLRAPVPLGLLFATNLRGIARTQLLTTLAIRSLGILIHRRAIAASRLDPAQVIACNLRRQVRRNRRQVVLFAFFFATTGCSRAGWLARGRGRARRLGHRLLLTRRIKLFVEDFDLTL